MSSNQVNTSDNKPKRDKKGRLLPGYTANPKGRPEGSFSIKDSVRKYLLSHPEEYLEIIKQLATTEKHRELMWKMLEGNPPQKSELDAKIEHDINVNTEELDAYITWKKSQEKS